MMEQLGNARVVFNSSEYVKEGLHYTVFRLIVINAKAIYAILVIKSILLFSQSMNLSLKNYMLI